MRAFTAVSLPSLLLISFHERHGRSRWHAFIRSQPPAAWLRRPRPALGRRRALPASEYYFSFRPFHHDDATLRALPATALAGRRVDGAVRSSKRRLIYFSSAPQPCASRPAWRHAAWRARHQQPAAIFACWSLAYRYRCFRPRRRQIDGYITTRPRQQRERLFLESCVP